MVYGRAIVRQRCLIQTHNPAEARAQRDRLVRVAAAGFLEVEKYGEVFTLPQFLSQSL
jgi:hypothetical protein